MHRFLPFAALLFASNAMAGGTLQVERKGLFPTFAWVDGQPHGKVKGKTPLSLVLDVGTHEVWIAMDDTSTFTLCHGLVEITEGATTTVLHKGLKCSGLTPGLPDGPTAFKGASVRFTVSGDIDAWVSVDGGRAYALPSAPFEFNLMPGKHNIVLYRDVGKTSVFDQGAFSLQQGEQLPITCTPGGCMGFDQPPVVIVNVNIQK